MSAVMVLIGVALLVSHARARRRAAGARRAARPAVRRRRRRAAVPRHGGAPARCSGARSARRRCSRSSTRRSPARSTSRSASSPTRALGAHAGRLPPRRRVLRAGGDDLRRGRLAAPGPRRRDGLRALRLQRAVSFVAGWAILLDYMILIAVTAFSATNYLAAFWRAAGSAARDELLLSLRDHRLRRGPQHPRLLQDAREPDRRAGHRRPRAAGRSSSSSGSSPFFHLDTITDTDPPRRHADVGRHRLRARRGDGGLHRASSPPPGLAGEVRVGRRGLKRLVGAAAVIVMVVYVGIAIVARHRAAGRRQRDLAGAQLPRRADARDRRGLPHRTGCADALKYAIAAAGGRDADRRGELGDARASRGWPTRCRPTARSRARSAGCTRRARRPSWSSPSPALLAGGADRPAGPRLPRRDLRLRRAARADDRAPVDRRAALQASPTAPRPYRIPLSVRVARRRPAAAGGRRRASSAPARGSGS